MVSCRPVTEMEVVRRPDGRRGICLPARPTVPAESKIDIQPWRMEPEYYVEPTERYFGIASIA